MALLLGCLIGVLASISAFGKRQTEYVYNSVSDDKLNAIWSLVDKNYVDPLDGDSVMDKVYASVLSTLDPHSSYLPRKAFEKEKEVLRGNFEGVGVVIRMMKDTVCVSQVMSGGPSERAGLQAADRILSVDGKQVSGVGMRSDSVVALLRGPRKSTADVTIRRISEPTPRQVKIVRDVINTPSLTYSGMIDSKTGYIRLSRFGETTYDEFCEATRKLKKEGMRRMILDLRDNGGGALSSAIDICDELLPGREMIVYTQGEHQRRRNAYSSPGGLFSKGELIVMIDEFSASASEVVAGAIQDNDRGVIVGRRSFGKGLVQQQFALPDNSAVLLTIARYYTPSGRCIQRPYDKGSDEYYSEFVQHVMEEYSGDSLLSQVTDSTPYYTSAGRIVYGGGGILPDKTIHLKTDTNIVYYNKLLNKGTINDYVFDYVSLKGAGIRSRYVDGLSFEKHFVVSDAMMRDLFAKAENDGIKRNEKGIASFYNEIRTRVKAEIGDMLYGSDTFYKLLLPFDSEVKEAMRAFK